MRGRDREGWDRDWERGGRNRNSEEEGERERDREKERRTEKGKERKWKVARSSSCEETTIPRGGKEGMCGSLSGATPSSAAPTSYPRPEPSAPATPARHLRSGAACPTQLPPSSFWEVSFPLAQSLNHREAGLGWQPVPACLLPKLASGPRLQTGGVWPERPAQGHMAQTLNSQDSAPPAWVCWSASKGDSGPPSLQLPLPFHG